MAVRSDLSPLVDEWASSSGRIAYVHFKNVKTPTKVVSAYAPTRDAFDAVRDEFYDVVKLVLSAIPRKHLVTLGMYANAQFSVEDESPCLRRQSWYLPAKDTKDNAERQLQLA